MSKKSNNRHIFFILIAISIFALDRITKTLFTKEFCIFPFCIKPSINAGAAFGILPNMHLLLILVSIIIFLIVVFILISREFRKSKLLQYAMIFIIAGTLGNLADRIFYGYVIDWLTFSFVKFSSFNLADVSNLAGALLLLIEVFKKK